MDRFQHGGDVYDTPPQKGWLDFSANINPLGLAPEIQRVLQEAIGTVIHYPDPRGTVLRTAIGAYYGIPVENVLLGNGASELFYLFFNIMRPHRAIIPVPSFSEYERAALSIGCEVVYFPLQASESFALDEKALARQIDRGDVVLLGNPNNPTGSLLSREKVSFLAHLAEERGAWLILDESFLQFRPDGERVSSHYLSREYTHVIIMESLTKFFAIPGLRLGFASMSESLRKRMEQGKDVWNVNQLAQLAGVEAFRLSDYRRKSRCLVAEEAAFLMDGLQSLLGISPFGPSVNFILLNVCGTGTTSTVLTKKMREKGILIRDCANYPGLDGRSYLRIAVRSRKENNRLLKAWKEIL